MLRACEDTPCGRRMRALVTVLWRSGLRISEALALEERDLDPIAGVAPEEVLRAAQRRHPPSVHITHFLDAT